MPQFSNADPLSFVAVDALKKMMASRQPPPTDLGIPSVTDQHPMQLPQPAQPPDPNYPMGIAPGDPIYNKVFDQPAQAPNFDESIPATPQGISWPNGKPSDTNVSGALQGLKARQGDQIGVRDTETYMAQKHLKDEMERNIALQQLAGAGPDAQHPNRASFGAAATPADLAQVTDDLNEGPTAQAMSRSKMIGDANLGAQMQGFGGGTMPAQQAGRAQIGMEQAKISSPLDVENARGKWGVEQAQTGMSQLQMMLQGGLRPGEAITGGKSPSVRQSVVPLSAEDEKQLNTLNTQLASLPKPGSPYSEIGNALTPVTGGLTLEQHRQAIQRQIDAINARRGGQPSAPTEMSGQGQTIRVRRKQDNQTGTIPASSYDPLKYEQVQ